MDPLPPEYLATTYRVFTPVNTFALRIGVPNAAFDHFLASQAATCWAFLTAWNPGPHRYPPALNQARNTELLSLLGDFRIYPARGEADDTDYFEESFCVLDLPESRAVELARRFGQNAIVIGSPGSPPTLIDTRPLS